MLTAQRISDTYCRNVQIFLISFYDVPVLLSHRIIDSTNITELERYETALVPISEHCRTINILF